MKFAVTGHTQGIGKCIFNRLNPDIIGFSKSTGYNINNADDRSKIIQESSMCDVFINNACDNYGQVSMFIDLLHAWKDFENKTIINIGSRVADVVLPVHRYDLLNYQSQKLALKYITINAGLMKPKCNIKYKTFGYVGTEKILKSYPNLTDYITEDCAVDIILS